MYNENIYYSDAITGPELMKLPAVLYYKKGDKKHGISGSKHKNKHSAKHIDKRDDGDRRDVVFLRHPNDYSPTKQPDVVPTTSYKLFDYQSNYRKWLFLYPDEHPVHMQYVDEGKAADPYQQNTAQQTAPGAQDAAPAGQAAAPASAVATPAVGAAPVAAPAAGISPAAASTTASAAAPAAVPAAGTSAAAPTAGATPGVAPVAAQTPAPSVASAVPNAGAPAASNPAVPQVGQAAAAVQQPAAPIAAQQPVAAQQPAANETIQVINQTVSLASNTTGFVPSVANVSQPNQTIMAGAFTAGNTTSNETIATGSAHLVQENIN